MHNQRKTKRYFNSRKTAVHFINLSRAGPAKIPINPYTLSNNDDKMHRNMSQVKSLETYNSDLQQRSSFSTHRRHNNWTKSKICFFISRLHNFFFRPSIKALLLICKGVQEKLLRFTILSFVNNISRIFESRMERQTQPRIPEEKREGVEKPVLSHKNGFYFSSSACRHIQLRFGQRQYAFRNSFHEPT